MSEQVNIGIIGTGKAGLLFGHAVNASKQGNLVALAAATQDEADQASNALGGVKQVTDDWKALVGNDEVDAVFICSPTFLHTEMTLAAADAGRHVLCDKPMCLSSADADRMIAACDKAGVILMIGFIERFNNAFRVMKDRIQNGQVGDPVSVLSRRAHPPRKGSWIMDDSKSGGAFLHTGCHNIDLIQWLFDSPVTEVQAIERESGISPGFTDLSSVIGRLDNDVMMTQVESYAHPTTMPMGVDRSFEVLGTKGSLYLDLLRSPVTLCGEDGWKYEDVLTWVNADGQLSGALVTETDYFIDCVQRNEPPKLASARDGKRTVLVYEAAKEAARTGSRVAVKGVS
ncbi:MAG: Gfo/Idh/MocA family protein [Phycisphaeraceae bacterium]